LSHSPFIANSLSDFFSLTRYTLPTSPFPSSLIFWKDPGETSTERTLIEFELYVLRKTVLWCGSFGGVPTPRPTAASLILDTALPAELAVRARAPRVPVADREEGFKGDVGGRKRDEEDADGNGVETGDVSRDGGSFRSTSLGMTIFGEEGILSLGGRGGTAGTELCPCTWLSKAFVFGAEATRRRNLAVAEVLLGADELPLGTRGGNSPLLPGVRGDDAWTLFDEDTLDPPPLFL
jgi:hypothetical protein